jgi:type IV secretory pathway VirB2 component (pilin)
MDIVGIGHTIVTLLSGALAGVAIAIAILILGYRFLAGDHTAYRAVVTTVIGTALIVGYSIYTSMFGGR